MPDFSTDVTRWCEKAKGRADQVFRTICMDSVNRVKQLTPVDTGWLRSNWTVIAQKDAEPVAGRVPDPLYAIRAASVGNVLVIINPVVYARRIEYGFNGEDKLGRTYAQKGAHMAAQTVAEMPSIAANAVARLGNR